MKEITLTVEEANQLLNYLAEKPYKETAGLIQMISVKAQPKETKNAKSNK